MPEIEMICDAPHAFDVFAGRQVHRQVEVVRCVSPVVGLVRLGEVTVTKPFFTSTFVQWKKYVPQTKKNEMTSIMTAWRQFQFLGFHATAVGLRIRTSARANANMTGRLNFVESIAPRRRPRAIARPHDWVRRQ